MVLGTMVERELSPLKREARAVSVQCNETTIAHLPPEILSKIFLALVSSSGDSRHRQLRAQNNNLSWIQVTHVSQYWREVALGCQTLWSDLPSTHAAALEAFLVRSRTAPLAIQYHRQIPEIEQMLEGIIGREKHRLRALALTSYRHGFIEGLLSKSTDSALLLENVHLVTNERHTDSLPPSFLQGGAPALTHLEIDRIGFTWEALPIHVGLRSLILRRGGPPNDVVASAFVDSMRKVPSLHTLELRHVLPDITPPTTPLLNLSSLVSLRLYDTMERITQFLEVSSLPGTTFVSLAFTGRPVLSAVSRLLASVKTSRRNSSDTGQLPNPEISSCSIEAGAGFGTSCEMDSCNSTSQPPVHLGLRFRGRTLGAPDILRILRQHFEFDKLKDIEVTSFSHLSRFDWRAMFGQLTSLSTIRISVDLALLLALCDVLIEGTPEESTGDLASESRPWFPALRTLSCDQMRFERHQPGKTALFNALHRVVHHRRSGGLAVLPELESRIQKSIGFDHADEAAFEALAPDVRLVWDGYMPGN